MPKQRRTPPPDAEPAEAPLPDPALDAGTRSRVKEGFLVKGGVLPPLVPMPGLTLPLPGTAAPLDADKEEPPLHSGHRLRVRQRFLREGLEHFADHQVLELLLFYAIPRRDTNPLAHKLLRRYGSLSAVLEANPRDLASVPGLGELAGTFLALLPAVTRRYLQDRANREKPNLGDPEKSRNYLVPLMAGRTEEVFYTLCLDSRCQLLFPALICEGTVNEALISPRLVVEAVVRHKASSVILAHNHPSGNTTPSDADIRITRLLIQALIPLGVRVMDHVIVAGDHVFSMAQEGLIP